MGDSRYVVEPNVKDGKGGLRDLHTLYWIGKYVHGVERPADLVGAGLLTAAEFRRFDRAERFFWSVRCHLHLLAGRAEERLSFDYQPRIAEIMHYADRPGKSAVERFMQFYFLNAKTVGDLTGVFLAQLDEQLGKKGFRFALPTIRRRPKRLGGFVLDRGRIAIPADDFFRADPVRLVELFALAARERLEIHPAAMRAATPRRGADRPQGARRPARQRLVPGGADLRSIARARAALDERGRRVRPLRSRLRPGRRADAVRHVPPLYGRRAFDPRDRPARGDRARRAQGDHPLSTAIIQKQIASRRVLYVAVLLHDIAKGRGGDHSVIGAEIALKLGPRFGLDPAETETVSWLVRYHLLMSSTAFKRDLADPKTIEDFVRQVQSPERLRLLLILTVVDIRAVGPGRVERVEADAAADLVRSRRGAAAARPQAARPSRTGRSSGSRSWPPSSAGRRAPRAPMPGACPTAIGWPSRCLAGRQRAPGRGGRSAYRRCQAERRRRGRSRERRDPGQRLHARPRRPVLPHLRRARGGRRQHHRCAHPHDARRHGARQSAGARRPRPSPIPTDACAAGWSKSVEAALSERRHRRRCPQPSRSGRSSAFEVAPSVAIAERASTRTTVVEVNARDRPALLAGLAAAIHRCGHHIHSAHIATYGERAVDVFYLTRADGKKLDARATSSGCARRCSTPPATGDGPRPHKKRPAAGGPRRSWLEPRSARWRWRRRRWRAGGRRGSTDAVRAGLRRAAAAAAAAEAAAAAAAGCEAQLAAQRHAEGPRLAEERAEELAAAGMPDRDGANEACGHAPLSCRCPGTAH